MTILFSNLPVEDLDCACLQCQELAFDADNLGPESNGEQRTASLELSPEMQATQNRVLSCLRAAAAAEAEGQFEEVYAAYDTLGACLVAFARSLAAE